MAGVARRKKITRRVEELTVLQEEELVVIEPQAAREEVEAAIVLGYSAPLVLAVAVFAVYYGSSSSYIRV